MEDIIFVKVKPLTKEDLPRFLKQLNKQIVKVVKESSPSKLYKFIKIRKA